MLSSMKSLVSSPRPGRKDRRGAAAAEFALVSGLMVTLMFGTLDFGLAMNAQLVLSAAAREGARRAAVDGGDTQSVRDKINQQIGLGRIDPARAGVAVSPRNAAYGSSIRVEIEYPYSFITPVGRGLAPSGILIKAGAVTRSEKLR